MKKRIISLVCIMFVLLLSACGQKTTGTEPVVKGVGGEVNEASRVKVAEEKNCF